MGAVEVKLPNKRSLLRCENFLLRLMEKRSCILRQLAGIEQLSRAIQRFGSSYFEYSRQ